MLGVKLLTSNIVVHGECGRILQIYSSAEWYIHLLSDSMEEQIGGPAYMGARPYVAYTYLTYTSCLCLFGAIGNICVLSSFAVNKKLRSAQNVFLVNLALADLVVTTIGDPLSITGQHFNP